MRRSVIPIAAILLLASCQAEAPTPAAASESTDPLVLSRAYLNAWVVGDDSHRALEFRELPSEFLTASGTRHQVPQKRRIRLFSFSTMTGIAAKEGLDRYAFTIGDKPFWPMAVITPDSPQILYWSVEFEVTLDDGSIHEGTLALRPDAPLTEKSVYRESTPLRVLPRP